MADDKEKPRPIIIKRIKKVSGGHHGGAWKVAYADFTTAMMAFFMLLWLLNVTTKEQKAGLADYFAPTVASMSNSGAGGVMGGTSLSTDGAQNGGAAVALPEKATPPPAKQTPPAQTEPQKSPREIEEEAWQRAAAQREENMFQQTEAELRQSIQEMADLKSMNENLAIDVTKDGMRIQLIDNDHRSMFKSGTAELYNYARKMLDRVAVSINKMPNRISITGHTDSQPLHGPKGYSNWELSADRANAARRELLSAGVSPDRFSEVQGKAGTDPLIPDNRSRPENRRITILLIREAPVVPPQTAQ